MNNPGATERVKNIWIHSPFPRCVKSAWSLGAWLPSLPSFPPFLPRRCCSASVAPLRLSLQQTALRFMPHRFNTDNIPADPRFFQSSRLKGANFSPPSSPPLLSSNPRLYQLSIKKIQLQFGIRQNALITKSLVQLDNLILVQGGLSGGLTSRKGRRGKKKTRNVRISCVFCAEKAIFVEWPFCII